MIQELNYNKQIFIPKFASEQVGFKAGDKIKLIINKNKTITLKKIKDD